MLIRKIKLHNFRQFDEALIEFEGHGIELLLGTAGSGKTTIAEAIKWALSECGYSQFADTSIINIDVVKKAMLAEILEASVELELSDQEHTYKVYKVLRGKREPRNKYTVVDKTYHLFIQKCDGELSECKEKMILPKGYEILMFASNDEISSITRRNGLKKYIERANANLQIVYDAYEYCRFCKRDIHMRLPSSNSLSDCEKKLELLDERIRQVKGAKFCLEEEKEKYEQRLSEFYAILNITKKSIMDMEMPSDESSLRIISEVRLLKNRIFDVENRLAEELKNIASYERARDRIEHQRDKLLKDERITRWQEELKYLDALETWIKENYEYKKRTSYELIEKKFHSVLMNIGIENCDDCSLEDAFNPKIENCSWKRELYYLAFVFACRDVFVNETEEDNVISVPLILDFSLSAFGKYEGEKVIRYITSRTEQIILMAHPQVDYYGGISGINQLYNIVSNPERTSARIEKQG